MNYSDNSLRKDEIDRQINQMLLRVITQLPQEAVATVVDESGSDLSLQNIDPKKLVEIVIQVFQVLKNIESTPEAYTLMAKIISYSILNIHKNCQRMIICKKINTQIDEFRLKYLVEDSPYYLAKIITDLEMLYDYDDETIEENICECENWLSVNIIDKLNSISKDVLKLKKLDRESRQLMLPGFLNNNQLGDGNND